MEGPRTAVVPVAGRDRGRIGGIEVLHGWGVRSGHAYTAGFASIGLSFASWLASRGKADDSKSQSDRWGIFVGQWAPTFFALGIALRHEDKDQ